MNTATIIRDQIRAIDPAALMAWGSKELVALPTGLRFKTSGLVKWKGYVQIDLDTGADLYNLKFFRARAGQIKQDHEVTGVFAEDLVNIIDQQVG